MADSYFRSVTSAPSFHQKFAREKRKTFIELNISAASYWGREELFGCRVIRRPTQPSILPILSKHVSPLPQPIPVEIEKFLEGPGQGKLDQSEHALVREYGMLGQLWAALAVFKGSHPRRMIDTSETADHGDIGVTDNENENAGSENENAASEDENATRQKRIRRNTSQGDTVVSSQLQIDSSSPLAEDSQRSSSIGYVDKAAHLLAVQPEDGTIRLASCVVRHFLLFSPPQDSETLSSVVEFRDAKCRLEAWTPLHDRRLVYTDDGALCFRQVLRGISRVTKNRVAMLEAKSHFENIEDGSPVISDNCFAQMTCQALVARLADPMNELQHERVILINATQHYMCFLEFNISNEYLDDFESTTPHSFIHVTATPLFDLSSRSGRYYVGENLRGIMHLAIES